MPVKDKTKHNETLFLRKITEQQWCEDILKVAERCRAAVARVIWFDFWSNRLVSNRWAGFDQYLNVPQFDELTAEELIEGLVLCNYSRERAEDRIRRAE